MKRFVEGIDRGQATLFPECLADWISENNPVRVIDAFVDRLEPSVQMCRLLGRRRVTANGHS
jgi:hypothetical protein